MKKNIVKISVAVVCLAVVGMCTRFQSCSNIMGDGWQEGNLTVSLPPIQSEGRAISTDMVGVLRAYTASYRLIVETSDGERLEQRGEGATYSFEVRTGETIRLTLECLDANGEPLVRATKTHLMKAGLNTIAINLAKDGEEMPYDITWELDGGVLPDGIKTTYIIEDTYALPVPQKTGYEFMGWHDDSSLSESSIVTGIPRGSMGDKTFYAKWSERYGINWQLNGGSISSGRKDSYIAEDAAYTLPVPTKADNVFLGWYATSNFSGGRVTALDRGSTGNKTFYAKWSKMYSINWQLDGGSISSGRKDSYIAEDAAYTLPVPTKADNVFLGWYASSNFSGSRVTSLKQGSTGDKTFYAKWMRLKMVGLSGNAGSFSIADTQVTRGLWKEVMGWFPENTKEARIHFPKQEGNADNNPIAAITWLDAVVFCNALSALNGKTPCYAISGNTVTRNKSANGYRLPTSEEWLFAARAGKSENEGYGLGQGGVQVTTSNLKDYAQYGSGWSDDLVVTTHEVGKKLPNNYGLYDMHGNVWEWTFDSTDSRQWRYGAGSASVPNELVLSNKIHSNISDYMNDTGFRVACN